ncbi:MAG: hypothetical protein ABL998_18355 [Planctomycetota bacterium]
MVRIRRGNFLFLLWRGDHPPRHVHVYRDRKLVVVWDLEHWRPLRGTAPFQVMRLLIELRREGLL